jgi:hypothetical protein
VRFLADDDGEGHADRFWALMLACGAANLAPHVYGYRPAPVRNLFDGLVRPRGGREDDDSDWSAPRLRRAAGWFGLR